MRTGLEPAPTPVGPGISVAVAGVVLSTTVGLWRRPYLSWDVASSSTHEVLWLGGSVIAALSALYGAFFHARASSVHAARPRTGVRHLGTAAAGLFAWSTLGVLVGVAPLLWRSVSTATWGGLGPRDVLIALMGIALIVCLGLLLGVLASHWLAAPVAAVLTYLAGALPQFDSFGPAALLQPVQQRPPSPQFRLSDATTLYSSGALAVGAATAVLICAAVVTARRASVRTAGLLAGVWVVLTVVAFTWRPDVSTTTEAPISCRRGEVTVCAHPAHKGSLDAMSDVTTRISSTAPGLLDGRRVVDGDTATEQQAPGDLVVSLYFPDHGPNELYQDHEQVIAGGLTERLLLGPCSGQREAAWGDAHAVRAEVLRRSGYADVAERMGAEQGNASQQLSDLSDASFAHLMTQHAQALRHCDGLRHG